MLDQRLTALAGPDSIGGLPHRVRTGRGRRPVEAEEGADA